VRRDEGRGEAVLVVDDDASTRALLVSLLERIGCEPHEAAAGDEALDVAEAVQPALVLLDIDLPRITGYEVCHVLRERFGDDVSIMFVSGARVEAIDRVAGLLIGADDYMVKPFDPDELVGRVRVLLGRRNRHGSSVASPASPIARLTPREREVVLLLAQGKGQDEIAAELFISPKTVATHIQRALGKLGVHSRAQAVALVHRAGLLDDFESHLLLSA
jgi:DNA-binding NarL/FixJ family response regulator